MSEKQNQALCVCTHKIDIKSVGEGMFVIWLEVPLLFKWHVSLHDLQPESAVHAVFRRQNDSSDFMELWASE